jgi:hypothetical protein
MAAGQTIQNTPTEFRTPRVVTEKLREEDFFALLTETSQPKKIQGNEEFYY